jgi:hypothetical protein
MRIPGFTAEQSLGQHQGIYSQRSRQPVEAAGEVRPQFIRELLIEAASRCCIIDGNLNCCRFLGNLIASSLGG